MSALGQRLPRLAGVLTVLLLIAPFARGDDPITGAPAPGSVAESVERLDDRDPARRAHARAELRARGPAVLAELPAEREGRTLEQWRALEDVRRAVREDWGRSRTPEGMVYVPAGLVRLPTGTGLALLPGPDVVSVPAFYLDRTEVTVGAWRAWRAALVFVGQAEALESLETPEDGLDARLPVTSVRRESAQRYAQEVRGGRLPTREEYLRALRGPGIAPWPWGGRFLNGRAHLEGDGLAQGPLPVGSFPDGASRYGVLDLLGNVAEWSDSTVTSRGASRAEAVVWGGHWKSPAEVSLAWGGTGQGQRVPNQTFAETIGFRVARPIDPLPARDPAEAPDAR